MSNKIQLKRRNTAGQEPSNGDIDVGELIINTADGKIFYGDDSGDVQEFTGSGSDAYTLKVDSGATAGYLGVAYNDGILRTTQNEITVSDGGNYITLGLSDSDTARTALGLAIGSDVQAYDQNLADIAGMSASPADSNIMVGNGSAFVLESGSTLRTSIGLGSLATASTISNSDWSGTDLSVANGGTGASSLTDGGVLLGSGTGAITAMSVLSDGQMIVGDGSGDPVAESGSTLRTSIGCDAAGTDNSTDVTLANTNYLSISGQAITGGTVPVGSGGTGATSLTDGGVLLGSGSSAVTAMSVLSDGQMIVGDGSGDPVAESGSTLRTSIGCDPAGGSTGLNPTAITDLIDTTIADADYLIFSDTSDSGALKKVDAAELTSGGGGGASALNDLSDVTYSSGDLTISSLDTLIVDDFTIDSSGTIEINTEDGDLQIKDGSSRIADFLTTNYSIQNHGTINLWNETTDFYSGIAAGEGSTANCTFYLPNTYTTAGYYLSAGAVSGTTKVKMAWTAPPVDDGTLRHVAYYRNASPGILEGDAGLTFHSGSDALVCAGTITSGTDQVCDAVDLGAQFPGNNSACSGFSGGVMSFATSLSDSRLKNERTAFGYGISELKQLSPEYYEYNKTAYETANSETGLTLPPPNDYDFKHVGLMAQDVEALMPELVHEVHDTGYKYINKDALIFTLINAVKELEARIATLESA